MKALSATNFDKSLVYARIYIPAKDAANLSERSRDATKRLIIKSAFAHCAGVITYLQEDQDWGFVAMVLDRLFLWVFAIASLVGTVTILCEAPALYDDTKPIDIELSSIARQMLQPNKQLENLIPPH